MSDLFLNKEELQSLTGKKLTPAQVCALSTMGIVYKRRPDGFPVVMRAHVEKVLGAITEQSKTRTRPIFE